MVIAHTNLFELAGTTFGPAQILVDSGRPYIAVLDRAVLVLESGAAFELRASTSGDWPSSPIVGADQRIRAAIDRLERAHGELIQLQVSPDGAITASVWIDPATSGLGDLVRAARTAAAATYVVQETLVAAGAGLSAEAELEALARELQELDGAAFAEHEQLGSWEDAAPIAPPGSAAAEADAPWW